MGDLGPEPSRNDASKGKKQILLNAFDMSTVGHLSPGQWKVSHQHTNISFIYPPRIDMLTR